VTKPLEVARVFLITAMNLRRRNATSCGIGAHVPLPFIVFSMTGVSPDRYSKRRGHHPREMLRDPGDVLRAGRLAGQ